MTHKGCMYGCNGKYLPHSGQGRKKSAGILQRGELLQPGRYQHINFIDNLERKSASSAFKSSGRSKNPTGYQVSG